MTTLKDTLEQLGGLHDARVTSIRWEANLDDLGFTFEDIYANFKGLANYPGTESGSIVLRHVKEFVLDMTAAGNAYIYEFAVEELQGDFLATVLFRPSGKITAKFTSADFPEVRHECTGKA
jgi:hypothetical protein